MGDGRLTPSLNLSLHHDSGLFASVWVSRAEISGLSGTGNKHETEAEYSLGYHWQVSEDWSLVANHAWLEYEQSGQPRNHDYRETRLSLNYTERTTFFVAHTKTWLNSGNDLTNVAWLQRFALPFNVFGESELGVVDLANAERTFYPYLRVTTGVSLAENWSASLEYNYSDSRADDFFNSDRTGSQWLGRVSYHF